MLSSVSSIVVEIQESIKLFASTNFIITFWRQKIWLAYQFKWILQLAISFQSYMIYWSIFTLKYRIVIHKFQLAFYLEFVIVCIYIWIMNMWLLAWFCLYTFYDSICHHNLLSNIVRVVRSDILFHRIYKFHHKQYRYRTSVLIWPKDKCRSNIIWHVQNY